MPLKIGLSIGWAETFLLSFPVPNPPTRYLWLFGVNERKGGRDEEGMLAYLS